MQFYLVNLWYGERGEVLDLDSLTTRVPAGWKSILRKGFQEMFDLGWDGEIRQIKEKFGSLRLYIQNETDEIEEVISRMEDETDIVCSVCGSPKTKTSKGWIKHYCDEHFPEHE